MQKRILIVDDDAAIGEVLQLILEDAGYAVEIQMDGQIAQQIAREAGADDFLEKPFQMGDILSLAAKYLERASGEGETARKK